MTADPIPRLAATAHDVLSALDAAGIPACVIGGLAVLRWGEQRATRDVDVSVQSLYGDEEPVLSLLTRRFPPRRPDAREMALASRVLLLRAPSGVPIDIALASFEFELEAIRRATPWEIVRDVTIRTCSAEDLIIYKLVAARGQDLVDVDGIVMRQRHALDAGWIRRWAPVFEELKEDPDLLRPFERVWARIQLP